MNISANLKRISLLLLFIVTIVTAQAQANYGNEWINYEQTYHKIKVTQTGIHQLDYAYLSQLGLEGVNPQNLQLFRRGKEVAIHIAGEQDGKLDPQDYLEFYGERNDGALDAELYKDPSHQPHQYYSLYTDTAAYFLTFSTVKGKRMQQSNPAVSGKTPEPYHIQKALMFQVDAFYRGKTENGVEFPWFSLGEGYVGSTSRNQKNYPVTGLINLYTGAAKPVLKYLAYARNDAKHEFSVRITDATGKVREIGQHNFHGFGFEGRTTQLEFSDINVQGTTTLSTLPVKYYTPKGEEITTNQVSMSFATVTFAQQSIVVDNNMIFYTDSTRSQTPYFSFTNASATTVAYDITDPNNIIRTEGIVAGNVKGYVINAQDKRTHKILLSNTANPFRPAAAKKLTFRNVNPKGHNYIIITNKLLMAKALNSAFPAPIEYAAYRSSQAGGSYDTLVVFTDDLINQFHYGEYSSNAVRNFLKYMQTSAIPKQALILGKGVELDRISFRNPTQAKMDLVPAAGVPASDNFFTADFRNGNYVPSVPIGRVTAENAADIINYLNKVKEYESQPEGQPWQKNILQLGGGTSTTEINLITSYLQKYKGIAEGPYLGANVTEYYRQNVSEAVEEINVAKEVNAGLSLVTFFGHSSGQTTDLDIGYASSAINGYNNKGKYPVMLMNGCATGTAFIPNMNAFGEDWIKTPNKGAIAYIAHVSSGYPTDLNKYSLNFYTTAFQDESYYGQPIGFIHQQTIRRIATGYLSSFSIATMLEMQLQGDPAVTLYSPEKPDYFVQDNSIEILGKDVETVTASTPEFTLKVGVGNLGKAITDSVYVSVKRTLADNTVILTDSIKIEPVFYADTIYINLSNEGIKALGLNKFEVEVDYPNLHPELNENNNIGSIQHYFPASTIVALSPVEYGIESSDRVKLIVQSTQSDLNKRGFYFEIDTTNTFSSSLKKSYTAENAYLPFWETVLADSKKDSTVYFWRVRYTQYDVGEDTIWASSSFRYIKNSNKGWSQSHRGQFSEATLTNIERKQLLWEFKPIKADIEIRTTGGANKFSNPAHNLIINGRPYLHQGCSNPAGSTTPRLIMMVLDNINLQPVPNIVPAYACSAEPYMYDFGDLRTAANRAKIETFLKAVPDKYYVIAISVNNVPFTDFSSSQRLAFSSIGSELIDNLATGYPFGIVGQKGAVPGSIIEASATTDDSTPANAQDLVLRTRLQANQKSGSITSSVIGPAVSWKSLHHNIERYEGGDDKYKLSVVGINKNGNEEVLVDDVTSKSFDLSSVIDVKQFNEIRLKAFLSDLTANTAPQLKDWTVLYEVAPEGVIRPDLVEVSESLISSQADKGKIIVPMIFQNITSTAFKDSLEVDVTVTGDGIQPIKKRLKLAPLAGNTDAKFSFEMLTNALDGNYKLIMYVNPKLQPEQQYFNNIYTVNFKVKPRLHPLLDVAFDGVHIMDGELISPSPVVSITLKDENKYIYQEDASGMSVILIDELNKQSELSLAKGSADLEFFEVFPATDKSDLRVEFKPNKMANGRYTMEIRAKDVTGKPSGISPYRINFEVENQSAITNFYPFPNPFSTKTNFIFTLTGATIPDHIKIQILTITGKVVKEIQKEELGPLRIGNNKTEYAWDGTDMYGDKLANGVYLYRVVVSRSDEMMYHKQKFGDKAFKNGYGKLYILR